MIKPHRHRQAIDPPQAGNAKEIAMEKVIAHRVGGTYEPIQAKYCHCRTAPA
jgi:hypothetical protein